MKCCRINRVNNAVTDGMSEVTMCIRDRVVSEPVQVDYPGIQISSAKSEYNIKLRDQMWSEYD